MRVTEKRWISKEIVVLKHTSCDVVEWRLNSVDLVGDGDGASAAGHAGDFFLDYLPEMIFVRFDDVEWQLKGLAVGVYACRTTDVAAERRYGLRSSTPWLLAVARLRKYCIHDARSHSNSGASGLRGPRLARRHPQYYQCVPRLV